MIGLQYNTASSFFQFQYVPHHVPSILIWKRHNQEIAMNVQIFYQTDNPMSTTSVVTMIGQMTMGTIIAAVKTRMQRTQISKEGTLLSYSSIIQLFQIKCTLPPQRRSEFQTFLAFLVVSRTGIPENFDRFRSNFQIFLIKFDQFPSFCHNFHDFQIDFTKVVCSSTL